jgi:acylphosphatase
MTQQEQARLYAIIEGRVQGVGFRMFVKDNARSLGVDGWVRNLRDGTVEVVAEGEREKLGKLLNALHRGPSASRVTQVKPEWQDPTGGHDGFRVKMTY